MKKWFVIGILAILFLIFLWLISRPSDAKIADSTMVPQLEKVMRGELRVEVTATGIIQPINKVEIKSKASGMIEEMRVQESDPVFKGDLIARLDQRDTKNAYDQAMADLEVAEANVKQKNSDFQRKKDLYEKGLLSATDFDLAKLAQVDAQAQLVRAKINVDNNDIRLKDCIVRSPIIGIILTKNVEEGQIISSGISSVSGGTLIATVADMNEVYVKADVDEVDIGKIQPGMNAKIAAAAYPDKIFDGTVIRMAAQSKVVQNVTTFEVTIQVQNPSGRLKAGMNTSVEILVADKKNILLVANEALMTRKDLMQEIDKLTIAANPSKSMRPQGGDGEMGRRGESKARPDGADSTQGQELRRGVIIKTTQGYAPRMVKTGISNLDYTEIQDGLQEGDQVVFTFFSRAKQSSEQFRQRMTSMSTMQSGFRNQPARPTGTNR